MDSPLNISVIRQLDVDAFFSRLTARQKLYAHHLCRAAWHGARIVMRQTSPESIFIFELIKAIDNACEGQWETLAQRCGVTSIEVDEFMEYAALFLCNLGNFYGEGNQKIVPNISTDSLWKLACISRKATDILEGIIDSIFSVPPHSLGFPDTDSISNYYPGTGRMTKQEIANVSSVLDINGIRPENTRIRKITRIDTVIYHVLQASTNYGAALQLDAGNDLNGHVHLMGGDHGQELIRICSELAKAVEYAASEVQSKVLLNLIESFKSGSLETFRESQKLWVTDKSPEVENMIGFVEPYRDPFGTRAEWGAVICITDRQETLRMRRIVDRAIDFIHLLPWSTEDVDGGNGPFEKPKFEAPEFTSVHALAFCASTVWGAANLPNYEDIRDTCGTKNFIIANCMHNNNSASPCPYVSPSDLEKFSRCNHSVRFITAAIHGLIGHSTGKLLSETAPGEYNFNKDQPPLDPITKEPVRTWYKLGQTWTGLFEDLAMSVEECRATLISQYLIDNKEILSIFGYDDSTVPTADDVIYNTYLQIGVEGLQALAHFNVKEQTWGEAHMRGHFGILKYLLTEGNGVLTVHHDLDTQNITIQVDQDKILSDGKAALGQLLCRLHVWRCTADLESCKSFYESLTAVNGQYEDWRQIVCQKPETRWKYVQPNTLRKDDNVEIKLYETSNKGIIRSWIERDI